MGTSEGDTKSQNVWVPHSSNDWSGADVALHGSMKVLLASGVRVLVTHPLDAYSTAPITLARRLSAQRGGQFPVLRQEAGLLLHRERSSDERYRTRIVTAILGKGGR